MRSPQLLVVDDEEMKQGLSFIKEKTGAISNKVLEKLGHLKKKGGFGTLLKALEPFAKKHLGQAIDKLCAKGEQMARENIVQRIAHRHAELMRQVE